MKAFLLALLAVLFVSPFGLLPHFESGEAPLFPEISARRLLIPSLALQRVCPLEGAPLSDSTHGCCGPHFFLGATGDVHLETITKDRPLFLKAFLYRAPTIDLPVKPPISSI